MSADRRSFRTSLVGPLGCAQKTIMPKLKRINIKGFRSIKEMSLEVTSLNVMIGANGAGKSNLISFLKMMNELMAGRLQEYVATTGRATANLHFGPKKTPQVEARLEFEVEQGADVYEMRLFHAAGDSLVFADESVSFHPVGSATPKIVSLGAGHKESGIDAMAAQDEPTAKALRHLLHRCRVYHFHDTSPTARVRQYCYTGANRWLMPDAANLAAILHRLRTEDEQVYRRIVATIRQVAPFFDDFNLEPTGVNDKEIILNWRHRKSDLIFGPHQLSDGTLRAICLISLLMQPEEELPYLIVIDEPELGLHPYALDVVASLCQTASHHAQLLVSTQSSSFLNSFDPEDIVVVEREGEATTFKRPDAEKMNAWLEDYTLGEVWEKNVIGGGPH